MAVVQLNRKVCTVGIPNLGFYRVYVAQLVCTLGITHVVTADHIIILGFILNKVV